MSLGNLFSKSFLDNFFVDFFEYQVKTCMKVSLFLHKKKLLKEPFLSHKFKFLILIVRMYPQHLYN